MDGATYCNALSFGALFTYEVLPGLIFVINFLSDHLEFKESGWHRVLANSE